MVIEGRYSGDANQVYDLLIVGSGLAAQSLLSSKLFQRLRVAVVESGHLEPDPWTHSLKRLETEGLSISLESRERYLGGTSNTWQKVCVPLDPIDLRQKPWVAQSGWPIEESELGDFYNKAADYLSIPKVHEVQSVLESRPACSLVSNKFCPTLALDTNHPNGFAPDLLQIFRSSKNWDLYLGWNASGMTPEESHPRVKTLSFQGRHGPPNDLKAQVFVLACGGIENARLLLLSQRTGFLDDLPMLGRCFMEHPKGEYGLVVLNRPLANIEPFEVFRDPLYRYCFGLRLNDECQEHHGLLNCSVRLLPRPYKGLPKHPVRALAVKNFLEMAPCAENRVELSEERDHLGLRRGKVVCKIDSLSKKSLSVLHRHLANHLDLEGLGRFEGNILEQDDWPITKDASHHMGATRMGQGPSESVVDGHGKVHGLDNLYVAGSSVFPTSGHSNPSYTVIALCLRLAEHLSEKLK